MTRPSRAASRASKSSRLSLSSVSTTSSSWSPTKSDGGMKAHETVSGQWIEDWKVRTCRKCEKVFTMVNRRHHCRVCGHIFCHACSRTRMILDTGSGEPPKRRRVCDPCASHAQSSAILYDAEDLAQQEQDYADQSSMESLHAPEAAAEAAPSVPFMCASVVCFTAAFWFLKDEVSYTNPAMWILLAGLTKNVFELLVALQNQRVNASRVADEQTLREFSTGARDSEPLASPQSRREEIPLTEDQRQEIIANAHKSMDELWDLGSTNEGWTHEAASAGDVVLHSKDYKPCRIFKCETVIDLAPEELFDVLHGQFEASSSWNVTAAQNRILMDLDENIDLVHLVTAPALGGMVTSRDFVNSRAWRKQEGGYLVGSVCAGKNLLKTSKGVTRGENGATGFIILPHESSPFKSRFVWILNCDIKGYFPSSAIRKGSLSEMLCFVRNLRRHLSATRGSDSFEGEEE